MPDGSLKKIITLNLRYALESNPERDISKAIDCDGINTWENRKSIVIDFLRTQAADVVCFQEAQPAMVAFLKEALFDLYEFFGNGRKKKENYTDEYTLIAYRKDSFGVLAGETFWLSPTPTVPGSRFPDQHPLPRICTHVKLISRKSGEVFSVFNTHFCLYDFIRKQEFELLESMISKCEELCFLCGDLNARPEELRGYNHALFDLTEACTSTFHAFGKESGKKIDYILCNRRQDCRAKSPDVIKDGIYISDHNPLIVELI